MEQDSPLSLGNDSHAPRYKQLRDILAARIAAGEWRPGEPLPSESELTAQYGLATGTVRRAVEELISDGLVERQHGRGTFVRRASFSNSLFRFFKHETAEGIPVLPPGRILSCADVSAPTYVCSVLNLPAGEHAINIERHRIHEGKVVVLEDIWLGKAKFAPLLNMNLIGYTGFMYPMYDEQLGHVIASAHESLAVTDGTPAQCDALGIPHGSSLVSIERIAYGFDNLPLEWRISRGPASQFRYSLDIR